MENYGNAYYGIMIIITQRYMMHHLKYFLYACITNKVTNVLSENPFNHPSTTKAYFLYQ